MWARAISFVDKKLANCRRAPEMLLLLLKSMKTGDMTRVKQMLSTYIFDIYPNKKDKFVIGSSPDQVILQAIGDFTPELNKPFQTLHNVCISVYNLPSISSHYKRLVEALRKLKKKFEKSGAQHEWFKFVTTVKSFHSRKTKFVGMLEELCDMPRDFD